MNPKNPCLKYQRAVPHRRHDELNTKSIKNSIKDKTETKLWSSDHVKFPPPARYRIKLISQKQMTRSEPIFVDIDTQLGGF